jgi:hypothetical protein
MRDSYFELFFGESQLTEKIGDGIVKSFGRRVVSCRLHSKNELVFQGMRHFISRKYDIGVFVQLAEIEKDGVQEKKRKKKSLTLSTYFQACGPPC